MFKFHQTKIYQLFVVALLFMPFLSRAQVDLNAVQAQKDTVAVQLHFPFSDEGNFDYPDQIDQGLLYLQRPSNIETIVEYDADIKQYVIYEKIGDMYYRSPKTMSLEEFIKYDFQKSIDDYWKSRKDVEAMENQENSLIPSIEIESELFNNIFGSNKIEIKPKGFVEVAFGGESSYIDDPNLSERLRRVSHFDFDNQINLSVIGKIGDKVDMKVNYNTEATFDYENKMNINYEGKEDEILRKIEAGNVSLPLNGTLIQGGTNLFGVKTEMQFGKLNITTVLSQYKGEASTVESEGGAQKTNFEISASDYDENRHFFLSKYFREHYDESLENLPTVKSNITINKIEVWVTNKSQNFDQARNIVGFVDLGEEQAHITNTIPEFQVGMTNVQTPSNYTNNMYAQIRTAYVGIREASSVISTLSPLAASDFENGKDWEKIDQARKLSPNEYTLNRRLGYISLNSALNNDEVLAVAYSYSIEDTTLQVGEFSTDGISAPQTLILKLIKGTSLAPELPTWDLMMKNIYSLSGAYDLSPNNFNLNIVYQNDSTSTLINYLPGADMKDTVLLRAMNLDNTNSNLDYVQGGDGMFDFIEGYTVLKNNGRIIFPVLEPFGSNLADKIQNEKADTLFVFQELYDGTKIDAENNFNKNKFFLTGSYEGSSGSEISLNSFNVAEGSVKVTSGGVTLVENVDYTVDYAMGRVKIINESILESGSPIQVSTESQDMYSLARKTMIGSYANYEFSDNFNIGGTFMYLNERPITNKVDYGEEPLSNMMLGLDFQYSTKAPFLTDLVNLLPFYETEAQSSIAVEGEVAKLVVLGNSTTNNAVYLDDFESVETSTQLLNARGWYLASTPQNQTKLLLGGDETNSLEYGYKRAKLAWYHIDPLFQRTGSPTMPRHIKEDTEALNNHYTRQVTQTEIFKGRDVPPNDVDVQTIFDLAYYPTEKGPYNYDTNLERDGSLRDPASRWGGIMRDMQTTNFETANYGYIEFWVMDPFIYDDGTNEGGDLYFNLGSVSEDILKDSRKGFENGLPISELASNVDTTIWGRVSNQQLLNQAFDNSSDSRQFQDVGFDGLSDADEQTFFNDYLNRLQAILSEEAYQKAMKDPSSDNYHYYRGSDYDDDEVSILDRYKQYNNFEGNSPTSGMGDESYATSATQLPDIEDINEDNTLSEIEAYYQYKVQIRKEAMVVGQNYVVDKVTRNVELSDGTPDTISWYKFKIPIREPDETIGNISGFKSIRFMRMFLTDFSDSVFLRFASLDLVRSDWRVVQNSLTEIGGIQDSTLFNVSAVDVEESGEKTPVNYVIPPDITREVDPSNPSLTEMNEQAMLLSVTNLGDGDARAVYKSAGIDMRQYKNLEMDVHAEQIVGEPLIDGDVTLFFRLGADYNNYYEYEIPLKLTEPGIYNGKEYNDRVKVWPKENKLSIDLSIFPEIKTARDIAMQTDGSKIRLSDIYEYPDVEAENKGNMIKVKGSPSIGNVDMIVVGVRNPKDVIPDSKSVEVWVNELRMSDTETKGGYASTGRMSMKLADLGNVTLAGSTKSVGWGSVNQTTSQRSMEDAYTLDFTTSVQLGKLFPESFGVKLPLYYGYSRSVSTPEYSPLNTDVLLSEALSSIEDPVERRLLLDLSQDFSERKGFNITNVSINPKRGKDFTPRIYNIDNINFTYAKNELLNHSPDVEKYYKRTSKIAIDYSFAKNGKVIEPFKSVKFLDNKVLQLIKQFNFYLFPQSISYNTYLNRNYVENQFRNNTNPESSLPIYVQKNLQWNRDFSLRFNLTKNLKFDFSNRGMSIYDEDQTLIVNHFQYMRDSVLTNLFDRTRATQYDHNFHVSYNLPTNYIPLLDWTSVKTSYAGNYNWYAGSVMSADTPDSLRIGSTITNSNSINVNTTFNFEKLYDKVPYLKKVNQKYKTSSRPSSTRGRSNRNAEPEEAKRTKTVKYKERDVDFRGNTPKSINHRLATRNVTAYAISEKGDTIDADVRVLNDSRITMKASESYENARVVVTGEREITESVAEQVASMTTRMLMGVRNITIGYTRNGGTSLPNFAFSPETWMFGANNNLGTMAPSMHFLMGWQDKDYGIKAAENNWLLRNNASGEYFTQNLTETYTFKVTLEPIPNLRLDITGTQRKADNSSNLIYYNSVEDMFSNAGQLQTGNFSMSAMTIKTAFVDDVTKAAENGSPFENFVNYRSIIADRLNEARGYDPSVGYALEPNVGLRTIDGVNRNSSEVIIPAILAAYSGTDPNTISLRTIPGLEAIRPNWSAKYSVNPGNIDWMRNIFKTFNINHAYRSNYSLGNYQENDAYDNEVDRGPFGNSWARFELDSTFVPQYDISMVSITESIDPLIGVDVTFLNDLSASVRYAKQRSLNFSFANLQMSQMIKNSYTVGVGYRFTGMDMIISTRTRSKEVSNDVDMRLDITGSDYATIYQTLAGEADPVSSGSKSLAIDFSADYMLSEKFSVTLYYRFTSTTPHTSSSYRTNHTNFGLSFNFSIF